MRLLLATVFVSLTAGPLLADPKPATPSRTPEVGQMATDDCAKARKLKKDCVLTITDGDAIEGSAPGSTGTTVTALPGQKHSSLIQVRRDFIQEILKSAEDL